MTRRPRARSPIATTGIGDAFVRSLGDLRAEEFDCVVVGGGIHGASLLREVARRGHRALLVERSDFGRGASARSLRILHGGLRYLQSLDLVRYGESVAARRWFLRSFPEFTAPRAFLLPLDARGLRRPFVFRAAFALDAWLSRSRNEGVDPSHHLPPGRVLGEAELATLGGELSPATAGTSGASGGSFRHAAFWSDGWIAEPQRLLIEMLRWAGSLGARVVGHTEPVRLIVEGERVTGLALRRGGEEVEVRTPLVLLATGSWTESVLASWGLSWRGELPTAMAFNVAVEGELELGRVGETRASGIGLRARDGRNAFLWSDRGLTHVGTVHLNSRESPEDTRVTRAEVAAFLAAVDPHLPGFGLAARRVVSVTLGCLPARSHEDPEMPHRDRIFSARKIGGPEGLQVVVGLKYTTAPEIAARIVARLLPGSVRAGEDRPPSRGPIRIPELLLAWDRNPDEVVALALALREEEAADSLADLMLGRMDGSDDPGEVEALAVRLAPRLHPLPEDAERELEGVTRALESQLPVER